MQIALHIGAHATDEDRLIKCLVDNKEILQRTGVSVPPPVRYRKPLRDALRLGQNAPATTAERDSFLATAGADPNASRLILANQHMLGVANRIFYRNELYGLLERRLNVLSDLFPDDELEIFVGLRNPATFIPAAFKVYASVTETDFLGGTDIYRLRWSAFLHRIQIGCPRAKITAWCNEDLPVIFGQIVRAMAGTDRNVTLKDTHQILSDLMSTDGLANFQSYIAAHPPTSDALEQRIIAAFAEKFGADDATEEEIDMPGWSHQIIDALTTAYDEDFDRLRLMPGIRFIAP